MLNDEPTGVERVRSEAEVCAFVPDRMQSLRPIA